MPILREGHSLSFPGRSAVAFTQQNAHYSSVPTRMSLFTCKKYVFLIEKNLSNFPTTSPPPPKTRSFYRGFVVIPTRFILEIQILVDKVMIESSSLVPSHRSLSRYTEWEHHKI
ncbi:hypothetical protein LEP1GSC081_2842 [Leptospira kirschneri str. H1]|uniref:Uncharacterized protein n=1 Tax=Leptospira kirschneri str. H1 TaxID=1049966 RepID=A0A0E2BBE7_9LEPT|nr:hypothetical protein LEP1GSC081_2842 [Leptospira kirschneri str. H1]